MPRQYSNNSIGELTVEARTQMPRLFVPAQSRRGAGAKRTEKKTERSASRKETTGSAVSSLNTKCEGAANENPRYAVSTNGMLLDFLPLLPRPNQYVDLRATGSVTLKSAGNRTKGNRRRDSNFLASHCRTPLTAGYFLAEPLGGLATSDSIEKWRPMRPRISA